MDPLQLPVHAFPLPEGAGAALLTEILLEDIPLLGTQSHLQPLHQCSLCHTVLARLDLDHAQEVMGETVTIKLWPFAVYCVPVIS